MAVIVPNSSAAKPYGLLLSVSVPSGAVQIERPGYRYVRLHTCRAGCGHSPILGDVQRVRTSVQMHSGRHGDLATFTLFSCACGKTDQPVEAQSAGPPGAAVLCFMYQSVFDFVFGFESPYDTTAAVHTPLPVKRSQLS